jgi:hypothetical protein
MTSVSAFLEHPTVDDVAVQDEFLATGVLEKMINLMNFAVEGAKVNIGDDHRFDPE